MNITIRKPDKLNYIVKITLYNGYHVDKVVYYRYDLPPKILNKWRWYFEYLAAKVKVANPKQKVELYIKQNEEQLLMGDYWIEYKRANLIKAKRSQLDRLKKQVIEFDDLFNSSAEKKDKKIKRIANELNELEEGIINFPTFPTYLNKIKEVL